MRRLIYSFITCITIMSCTLETSDNGKLDGFWQLQQLDSLPSNVSTNMKEQDIYWSVQRHLLEVKRIYYYGIFFRFDNVNDSLIIYDPYMDMRDSSDIKLTNDSLFATIGLYSLSDSFAIKTLTSDKMILESKNRRLYFRKY